MARGTRLEKEGSVSGSGGGRRNKRPTPATAMVEEEIARLRREYVQGPDWWVMLESGGVVIAQQENGKECTGRVIINRRDFTRVVRWWTDG
jgi:hypothetical protein